MDAKLLEIVELKLNKEFLIRTRKASIGGIILSIIMAAIHFEAGGNQGNYLNLFVILLIAIMAARLYLTKKFKTSEIPQASLDKKTTQWIEGMTLASAVVWGVVLGSGFSRENGLFFWEIFTLAGVSSLATTSLAPVANRMKWYFPLIIVTFICVSLVELVGEDPFRLEIIFFVSSLGLYCTFLKTTCINIHESLISIYTHEANAKEKQTLFEQLLESIPGHVSVLDQSLKYIYVNKRLITKFGPNLFLGKLGNHHDDSEFVIQSRSFIDSGLIDMTKEINISSNLDSRSERHLAHWHRSPVSGLIIIICINIEEMHQSRLELEKQKSLVVSLSNLSSLAELASGIAHEINNPISVVSGYPELIESQLLHLGESEHVTKIRKYCETIKSGANRVSSIVKSMKTMASRNSSIAISPTSVRDVLKDVYLLSEIKLSGQGITLIKAEIDQDIMVHANGIRLTQVLLNLIWNARDSLLSEQSTSEQSIRLAIDEIFEAVHIKVIDNGPGISSKHVSKLLSSSFTTKKEGLGLGLILSRSLAESMNGSLNLESARSPTIFSVTLKKVI